MQAPAPKTDLREPGTKEQNPPQTTRDRLVSPSGGMWDPKEVPREVVRAVYGLVRHLAPGRFFVETRAETVSANTTSAAPQASRPTAGSGHTAGSEAGVSAKTAPRRRASASARLTYSGRARSKAWTTSGAG